MTAHNHADKILHPPGECPACDDVLKDDDLRTLLSIVASMNNEGVAPSPELLLERTGFSVDKLVSVLNEAQAAGYIAQIDRNTMN